MPTSRTKTDTRSEALSAYVKLMRACESLTARIHDPLPHGLTITQFAVLEALYHLGPLCQGKLASKLLKSGGNLTLVVSNLERDGLVRRERSKDDLRFVTVALTARGEGVIRRIFPIVAARIEVEFATLATHELAIFGDYCRRLGLRESQQPTAPEKTNVRKHL